VYINCTKGFHAAISIYTYNVHWSNSSPSSTLPYSPPLSPPLFYSFYWVSLYNVLWSYSLPSTLSFPSLPRAGVLPDRLPLTFMPKFCLLRKHNVWFLSLAYLTQHDDLQFHLFSYKWHNFILLYGWILLYSTHFLYPFISCWALRLIP
jgi:hypothetical protein